MARRFNIGDKVIKFKPSYFNNIFHKNHYVEYGIVTDANDDRFTTQGKLSSFDSRRNYHECYQTGKLVYGYNENETFWFNMTTEMDLIEDYHKKVQEQFLMEVKTNNESEIARIESQIKALEKAKERLLSMEDAYMGYTTLKTQKHIDDMDSIFHQKLNMCNKL